MTRKGTMRALSRCVSLTFFFFAVRKIWEEVIEKTLNSKPSKHKYILLRSHQLVGAALVIFVKLDIVERIRNVETALKKVRHGSA